ncbi:hypothetical protein CHS0354_016158, partial [Potamilus streckersoni]
MEVYASAYENTYTTVPDVKPIHHLLYVYSVLLTEDSVNTDLNHSQGGTMSWSMLLILL